MDINNIQENTSTPKRRRLGTKLVLRPILKISNKQNISRSNLSPIHRQIITTKVNSLERSESPPLPSNQDEFLHVSRKDNNSVCDIPRSPVIENTQNISNPWESLSTSDLGDICSSRITMQKIDNEITDISDDMFHSRMEQEQSQIWKQNINHDKKQGSIIQQIPPDNLDNCETSFVSGQAILDINLDAQTHHTHDDLKFTMGCEKLFIENVEESFELVNQSICGVEPDKKLDKTSMFETKDSFLLDIKESGSVEKNNNDFDIFPKLTTPIKCNDSERFYNLPITTRSLFKTFRNIEKFYDWQEECLNLPAIRERRNLIYALPTSGGKTLVAEVLMLQEVLNRKKNALFILPFVAIVQEKIWSLSPFALNLDFLVEEYAGGKGLIPPKRRRKKKSIYIATIEKALSLIRSLIELDRLDELGLIVVDELHLIGEQDRGATLEILLTTVLIADKGIQIVGMSATIDNMPQLAKFLCADVFERQFRPVELTEYVKLGDVLHKMQWTPKGLEIVPDRHLAFDYSPAGTSLDPDWLGGLVAEVVPQDSCLVFCPTKKNCENVALLLSQLQRREMIMHRQEERAALENALRSEGASAELVRLVRFGVAFHHAGLGNDERTRDAVGALLHVDAGGGREPARAPRHRARAARGPRAPHARRLPPDGGPRRPRRHLPNRGEHSDVLGGGVALAARRAGRRRGGGALPPAPARARAAAGRRRAAPGRAVPRAAATSAGAHAAGRQVCSAPILGVALPPAVLCKRRSIRSVSPDVDLDEVCDESLRSLVESGALEAVHGDGDAEFVVTELGAAAKKAPLRPLLTHRSRAASRPAAATAARAPSSRPAVDAPPRARCLTAAPERAANATRFRCMELSSVKQLLSELNVASRGLVLLGDLHLLYLVTPDTGIKPDYRHYYSLYNDLDEEGVYVARAVGITEMNAIKMMTGKPITNVPESSLCRFYCALMLRDLQRQMPVSAVAEKDDEKTRRSLRNTVQSGWILLFEIVAT
ncbi:unnamed protein product [Diatraea saccharalis]|uniref:Helicase ATP-binding domain-containing protein n=1 Tax=Diatraea saccharalis TaxID=40085 RepID=A0A9N9R917_9NEOP|nr:unnamed protein product [Diatraea saccharalis]